LPSRWSMLPAATCSATCCGTRPRGSQRPRPAGFSSSSSSAWTSATAAYARAQTARPKLARGCPRLTRARGLDWHASVWGRAEARELATEVQARAAGRRQPRPEAGEHAAGPGRPGRHAAFAEDLRLRVLQARDEFERQDGRGHAHLHGARDHPRRQPVRCKGARAQCLSASQPGTARRTHAAQSPGARLLGVKAMQPPSCASAPRPYLAASPCRLTLSPLQAADLWSVGVILFAMLIGRYPFSQRESNVARNIVSATYSLPDDVQARRLPATCFGRSNASPCMRARACVPAQLQSRARRRCPAGLRH